MTTTPITIEYGAECAHCERAFNLVTDDVTYVNGTRLHSQCWEDVWVTLPWYVRQTITVRDGYQSPLVGYGEYVEQRSYLSVIEGN